MNRDAASRKPRRRRRSYDNTLREEQVQLTRRRILDAAVSALGEDGASGLTMADVAKRAGVSEPTLYRHFGSRERLYEELDAHAQATLGLPPFPDDLESMPRHVTNLFAKFEAHADLLRASMRVGFGREMRARGRARRLESIRRLVGAYAPSASPAAIDAATGVLRVLVSWETWDRLTGDVGLTTDAASDAVRWAAQAVIDKLGAEGGKG